MKQNGDKPYFVKFPIVFARKRADTLTCNKWHFLQFRPPPAILSFKLLTLVCYEQRTCAGKCHTRLTWYYLGEGTSLRLSLNIHARRGEISIQRCMSCIRALYHYDYLSRVLPRDHSCLNPEAGTLRGTCSSVLSSPGVLICHFF
jgi:hypothetical protein